MAKEAKPTTVAATTGSAGGGGNDLAAIDIQNAMDAAATKAGREGITDPDKIRDLKLAARESFKEDARKAAAKAAKLGARP